MEWQFAIINGRLAEIYFDVLKGNKRKIRAHCYVDEKTRWTKEEKRGIAIDKERNRFSYRNKQYRLFSRPE